MDQDTEEEAEFGGSAAHEEEEPFQTNQGATDEPGSGTLAKDGADSGEATPDGVGKGVANDDEDSPLAPHVDEDVSGSKGGEEEEDHKEEAASSTTTQAPCTCSNGNGTMFFL